MSQSDGETETGPVLPDSPHHTQRAKLFATVVGAIKVTTGVPIAIGLGKGATPLRWCFQNVLETGSHQLAYLLAVFDQFRNRLWDQCGSCRLYNNGSSMAAATMDQ